ncbi:MAG: hypothetical protein KDA85_04825 [Planctomycetaceae bacterium]|nr:hypothetical protein [Planctomycetaceae bacterium]
MKSAAGEARPVLTVASLHASAKGSRAVARWHRICGVALLFLLLLSVPIVVCMPLTSDTVLYDLQARTVLKGGVLYRDILEPNLPGIVWLHLLIRSLFGWSSVVIRLVDLILVGAACLILVRTFCLHQQTGCLHQQTRTQRAGRFADWKTSSTILLCLSVFYLSRNEWCHCQRDSWMLLPTALALALRTSRQRGDGSVIRGGFAMFALLEGFCWGLAFWLKPHIAVSVLAIIAVDLCTRTDRRRGSLEIVWILMGGILAGIPGLVWLFRSGAWPHFLEMQLEWNPEYLASGRARRNLERITWMWMRFHPWWVVHIVAVPMAIRWLRSGVRARRFESDDANTAAGNTTRCDVKRPQLILAALYLSWLAQTSVLQLAMDYIQVPALMLGMILLASARWELSVPLRRMGIVVFLFFALLNSPQLYPQRLQQWTRCFREGSTWDLRDQLACGLLPDWKHLADVAEFLEQQQVQTGDVTCFNVHCIHIYDRLQLLPSTRYVGISSLLELFPSRRDAIATDVRECGARFVVVDLAESPELPEVFPVDGEVVFSAGDFRVYATRSPGDTLSSD